MKKTIILFCALFSLLLAACDKAPENAGVASGKAVQSTEAGAGTGAAVSDTAENTNAVNPVPYVLNFSPGDKSQCACFSGLLETPEGYYMPHRIEGKGNFIYFCPRGGDTFRPLCSKPNCKHADGNCNAWVGWMFFGDLGYYNGELYAVDYHNLNVIKMNPDGTDHRVAASIAGYVDKEKYSNMCFFHHGKMYIFSDASYDLPLEEQVDRLMVLDLADGSHKELAAGYFQTESHMYPDYFLGDKVYLNRRNPEDEDGDSREYSLIAVDAVTGEVDTVLPNLVSGLYVTDSTLYYYEPDLTSFGFKDKVENPGFREYDVESRTVKDCGLPAEGATWAGYEEDYIYAGTPLRNNHRDQTIYFLSRDYELLDRLELTDGIGICDFTSDRIYFWDYYGESITHYIDKSKIGTGELELIPVKMVG